MKKINVTIIIIFLSTLLSAQNHLVKQWDYRFGGNYDDRICAFLQISDGSYILAGSTHSNISGDVTQSSCAVYGPSDYWLIKIDYSGGKIWDKRIQSPGYESLSSIIQTVDGGFILGGTSRGNYGTQGGVGCDKTEPNWDNSYDHSHDYWIIKTDSLGNRQWDKDFGGDTTDILSSIIQTTDGGYLIGGSSYSGISGNKTQGNWDTQYIDTPDYWIIKIDSAGNIQWNKTFGGTNGDMLTTLMQEQDGSYILGGYSHSNIGGDKTQPNWGVGPDYWIVKIDSIGNKLWDRVYGYTGFDYLAELKKTLDGGYILAGATNSWIGGDKSQMSRGWYDYWILKLDSLFNKQWDKDFGGTADELFLKDLFLTQDGGYLLSGDSKSNKGGDKTEDNLARTQTWVVKIDSLGNKQWDKTLRTGYPGSSEDDGPGLVLQTNDGCIAMANSTIAGIGGDKTQTSRGDIDFWMIKFCDTIPCYAQPPVITHSSDSLICTPAVSYQWYLNGQPLIGYTSQVLVIDSAGEYYYVAIIDSNGCFGISSGAVGTNEFETISNQIIVYPNPFKTSVNFSLKQQNIKNISFSVNNLLGQVLYRKEKSNSPQKQTETIDLSFLPRGIYFLEVTMNGERIVKKILKE